MKRGFILLLLVAASFASGITVCPDHGARSSFTGNRKFVFQGSKRRDFCEYSHPLTDLSGVHKFWSDCQ